jgi:hypothetical protein
MISRCISCSHLSRLKEPVQGRGLLYIGVCAHPERSAIGRTSFSAATENFASGCRDYEPKDSMAVADALREPEEA